MMNHYEALELSQTATVEQIHVAYRAQAIKYHPDKNKEAGATEKFKLAARAFEVLSDINKRFRYDLSLPKASRKSSSTPYNHPPRPKHKPYVNHKPILTKKPINEEERLAWIARHDPNIGKIRSAPAATRDIWGKPLENEHGNGFIDSQSHFYETP